MKQGRWHNFIFVNVYWFGLAYLWNGLGRQALQARIAAIVPLGVQGTAFGALTALGLIIAVVVQPVAGALSYRSTSRWGRRRPYLLVGTLLDLLCLAGLALAPNYWLLFLSYQFLQIASNVAHGAYQGLIPDLVPPERWGAAAGVKQVIEIGGLIITTLVTGSLLAARQFPLAVGWMGVVLLVTMLLNVWTVRETPAAPAKDVQPWMATVLQTFAVDVRRYPDYFWLLVARLCTLVGVNLISNFAQLFIQNVIYAGRVDADVLAAANTRDLLALIAIAIFVLSYPTGRLSDRIGRKPLVALAGLFGILSGLLLSIARGQTFFQIGSYAVTDLLAYGSFGGLAVGFFLTANWAWATDLVPTEEAGRYLGISNLATAGAGVLSNGLGGPLVDVVNRIQFGWGYRALFAAAAVFFALGWVLLVKVRETAGPRRKG